MSLRIRKQASIPVSKVVVDDNPQDSFVALTVIGGEHIGEVAIADDLEAAREDLGSQLGVTDDAIVVTKES